MIPALTREGLLPPERYTATLADVRRVFVEQAPARKEREVIFRALELFAERVWGVFPEAKLWVDGGFVTHKAEAPHDVDVVIVVGEQVPAPAKMDVLPLLTLQEIEFERPWPGQATRLQPMGGLIDGFLALEAQTEGLAFWDDQWRRVRDRPDDVRKGYLEVQG